MARPNRNASPTSIVSEKRTFFVTSKTYMGQCLLQTERNALLLIDVLRSYMAGRKFEVDDFVVMPDHLHLLFTLGSGMSVERAMGLVKGRFSYRMKKEHGYLGEVWQPGFSDERVSDPESFERHREYIAQNPVKAGLAKSVEEYPYCYRYLVKKKAAGAKAH
jgi:putative transposase